MISAARLLIGTVASALVWGAATGEAEPVVGWAGETQQTVAVRNNKAPEKRHVRLVEDWEAAEYARFLWNELAGELVMVAAREPRVAIMTPWQLTDVPQLFQALAAIPVTWGAAGRGPYLFGEAFARRFTHPGPASHCFAFSSEDTSHFPQAPDLARRVLYGYACSPTETSRETIALFANEITVRNMVSLAGLGPAQAATAPSEDAKAYALGGAAGGGLARSPLGYARWTAESGG